MAVVFVFQLALILLRLTDTVDWSWWLILMPVIAIYGLLAAFILASWLYCIFVFGRR